MHDASSGEIDGQDVRCRLFPGWIVPEVSKHLLETKGLIAGFRLDPAETRGFTPS